MLKEEQIIEGCKRFKKKAQRALYEKHSSVLYGICLRYGKTKTEADDIFQEGFLKIFSKIQQFKGKGSFEGWLKRIIINTAITYYRRNTKINEYFDVETVKDTDDYEDVTPEEGNDVKSIIRNADLSREDIVNVINELPDGYRIVFNLYVIEEKSHKEIAEMLKIKVNTSKSQLARARKSLQKLLYNKCKNKSV